MGLTRSEIRVSSMKTNETSNFSIELLKRNRNDLKLFAEYSQIYVQEVDKRPLDKEIEKIKSRSHIDHCWILKNKEKVGIVKIIRGNFYNFGVFPDLDDIDIYEILAIIEKDVLAFHNYKIEGTLHSKYIQTALERKYEIEFSRKKMELDLSQVQNCEIVKTTEIKPYNKDKFKELTDVYIDAYRGSIDERVGMFDPSIAQSAVRSIINNDFGKFRPDLSGLYFEGKELLGGILITILEDCAFVVIIGVKRMVQNKQIGRELMCYAIEKSIKHGYSKMRLWVTSENEIAFRLYDKLGFKEILSVVSVYKHL